MKNKNIKILKDFEKYCNKYPEQRFWQALRNWTGYSYIGVKRIVCDEDIWHDTFYFKGKDI